MWELRSALKSSIRSFFTRRGYLEIDTPVLVPCPGVEVHLSYFSTLWTDAQNREHRLFLRSSPELHMKQALSLGLEKAFQIALCFRNGGELTPWHHPEFTMLEWYEAGIGYEAFMDQTEELLRFTHRELAARFPRWVRVELPPQFLRLSVEQAFGEFAGIELVDQDPDLACKAKAQGISSVGEKDDFETAYYKVLMEKVEPGLEGLGGAVLFDYPASQAVLSKVERGKAKRFEFYLWGIELCNAFLELTDPEENRRRVIGAYERRKKLGHKSGRGEGEMVGTSGVSGSQTDTDFPEPSPDEAFFRALEFGIPPCAGNALGFDRWLALLMGLRSIAKVIPFRESGIFRGDGL